MKPRAERGAIALLIAGSAVCVAVILFLFRDPLIRSVSLPLAWILWALRVGAIAVGQRIVWALFVLAFAILAIATLHAVRPSADRLPAAPRGEGSRSRVSFWEKILSMEPGSRAARQTQVFELRRLALSVLAHTDGDDAQDLEGRIERGQVDAPACIRALFAGSARTPPDRVDAARIVRALEDRLGGADLDAGSAR